MYQMTLAEWQKRPKRRDQLLYNCSECDKLNDDWVPFSIGMSWQLANYQGSLEDLQIGSHTQDVVCAIYPTTDQNRRPTGINRRYILNTLQSNGIRNIFIQPEQFLRMLPHYKFVISPEGNGIDCHRHYEALMAGCIPIVERNERLLEKYGNCPILFTDDYSEIEPEYLAEMYDKMLHTTWDFSRLCLDTFDPAMQAEIKRNGNFWGNRLAKKSWYV